MSEQLDILKINIRSLEDAVHWLKRSSRLSSGYQINELSEEGMDAFEGFTSRFARVADILFNKVFRGIYYVEQGDTASWLDVTFFMEKCSVIDNIDNARIIRETRNDIVHEYALTDLKELFEMVRMQTPTLVNYAGNAIAYSNRLIEKLGG